VQAVDDELGRLVDEIVAAALRPLRVQAKRARVVRALVDFGAWDALRARDVEARAATVDLLDAWLKA